MVTRLVTDADDSKGHWVKIDGKPIFIQPGQQVTSRQAFDMAHEHGVGSVGKGLITKGVLSGRLQTQEHIAHTIALGKAYQENGSSPEEAFQKAIEHKTIGNAHRDAKAGDLEAQKALRNVQYKRKGQDYTHAQPTSGKGRNEEVLEAIEKAIKDSGGPLRYADLTRHLDKQGVEVPGDGHDKLRFIRRVLLSHRKSNDRFVLGEDGKIGLKNEDN